MPLVIIACSCMYGMLKENVKTCLLSYSTVSYIGLAMMCIYVIYKCLSWDVDQQQDLGKPSFKIVQPSHRGEVVGGPISCSEWKDSVCFERGARRNSFAAMLTLLGCSSMYKTLCLKKQTLCLMGDHYNNLSICVTDSIFICRLKINHKTHLAICNCFWD